MTAQKLLPPLMGEVEISLTHGKDLPFTLTWHTDSTKTAQVDLTGYSAKFQIRTSVADKGTPLLEYTSGVEITLGGAAGTIVFNLADTDNVFGDAELYYELEMTDAAGLKRPLIGGKAASTTAVVK